MFAIRPRPHAQFSVPYSVEWGVSVHGKIVTKSARKSGGHIPGLRPCDGGSLAAKNVRRLTKLWDSVAETSSGDGLAGGQIQKTIRI